MPFRDELPVDPVWWLQKVTISDSHLACCFSERNSSETRPHRRERRDLDLVL